MSTLKRGFDLFWAGLGILLLSPVFGVLALLIKLEDGGPVLFIQERVGLRGQPFRMIKFRSMVVDAERRGGHLTVGRDPRVTRIGAVLRKYKLDELLQLVNVIKGEMSLVGPRPEVFKYVRLYTDQQRRVLEFVPGITDPASVKFRDESELLGQASDPEAVYISRIMPEKIRMNLEYGDRATILTDFFTILRTIFHL